MSAIKKRLQALLDLRKDTEPGAIIIGTESGCMTFSLATGRKFPDFATEQEARDALAAQGITKICLLTERTDAK